ncbi:hypothetical protein PR048_015952 [Dryococelus australis]|uniref:C2H2-type domain-containing protein n=1 Tax=Dryococelus australis TaxID=614101 RepID=A0ABQ9HIR5_9NEOP|nr:hypothetical protein PR048_015952 [Dryococelus australis]
MKQEQSLPKIISEAVIPEPSVIDWIKSEEHDLNEMLQSEELKLKCNKKSATNTKENFIMHVGSHGNVKKQQKIRAPSKKSHRRCFVFKSEQFLVKSSGVRHSRKIDKLINDNMKCETKPTELVRDSVQRKEHDNGMKFNYHSQQRVLTVPLSCRVCKRVFRRRYHLCRHERTHSVLDEEPIFQCEVCGKNFSCKGTLRSHKMVHTGEKPCTCHICGKQFSQTGLYYHLRHVHGGLKEHTCDVCGRSFAAKPAMEDHLRIHTGERPYVCATCGKMFKTKATLYIHNKTHTDVFPFSCPYCEKLFRNQHEMVKHLVTHTGEKPHACDLCGRRFRAKNEVIKHKMLHSDDKPYVCSACGLGFKQDRYLKRHTKVHHPGM